MNLNILPMDRTHLSEIAALEVQCFSQPWSRELIAEELKNKLAVYFTALDERGDVLGYAGMHVVLDEGYITNIACSPSVRQQGIASALLAELIGVGHARKLQFLTLEVRESNFAARQLYEKFGFMRVGLRRDYYAEPVEDAVLMLLPLIEEDAP